MFRENCARGAGMGRICGLALVFAVLVSSFGFSQQATPVTDDGGFAKVQAYLDPGGSLYMIMDTREALKTWMGKAQEQLMGINAPARASVPVKVLDIFFDQSGLYDVRHAGVSIARKDGMGNLKACLLLPPEKKGLFRVLQPQPGEFGALKYAGSQTGLFSTMDLDFTELLAFVRGFIQAQGGAVLAAEFEKQLQMTAGKTGMPVEALLASLDNNLFAVSFFDPACTFPDNARPSALAGKMYPVGAFGVRVKNDTPFKAIKTFCTTGNIPFVEGPVGGKPGLVFVNPAQGNAAKSPAIVFDGAYIIFSAEKNILEKVLSAAAAGGGLKDSMDFLKVSAGLPAVGNALAYVSADFMDGMKAMMQPLLQSESNGMRTAWANVLFNMLGDKSYSMAAVRTATADGMFLHARTENDKVLSGMILPAIMIPAGALIPVRMGSGMGEASVRSNVSRARADMRLMATALEAFYVDNNSYPFSQSFELAVLGEEGSGATYKALAQITTPIAYITGIMKDPFSPGAEHPYYYFYSGPDPDPSLAYTWFLWSVGPDGSLNINKKADLLAPAIYDFLYDPTNGTTSSGDILRSNKGVY